MKINLGCGKDIKSGFVNVDFEKRDNALVDHVADLSKKIPFEDSSVEFIYSSHLIEHLDWVDGGNFIKECFRCLKHDGKIRVLLPDYRKIFKAYTERDDDFFKLFYDHLNNVDYPYYKSLVEDPESILTSRKKSPPPLWHTNRNEADRKKVRIRARTYKNNIEIVDWFVHQYGEHVMLYDIDTISDLMLSIGFSNVHICEHDKSIDSNSPLRKLISICIEAEK